MVDQHDSFWKIFFSATLGTIVLGVGVVAALMTRPDLSLPNFPHGSSGEPYAYAAQALPTAATSTYFYRESIPLGFSNSSWNSRVDWHSNLRHYEGAYAARAEFLREWGGIALSGAGHSTASYTGFSLAVYAEPGNTDLYLELYDTSGKTVGRQSLGWYFPSGKLETGAWQVIAIPLSNFGPIPSAIGGFAVIAPQKGAVYIDDVHLTPFAPEHAPWKPAADAAYFGTSLPELFARTPQTQLPFSLSFEPYKVLEWQIASGTFAINKERLYVGPPQKGGGMRAAYLGGVNWTDYEVHTNVLWGPTDSIALVGRIKDENTQVSCSYASLGRIVQIYEMKDGVSTLVRESAYTEMEIPSQLEWAKVPLTMKIKGGRVECYAYNRLLLVANPPHIQPNGSVGIEVWDEKPDTAPHEIIVFTVSPLK